MGSLGYLLSVLVVTPFLSKAYSFNFFFAGQGFAALVAFPALAFNFLQLSAIDVSARTTMKGTANCDKHCELQNSVNQ